MAFSFVLLNRAYANRPGILVIPLYGAKRHVMIIKNDKVAVKASQDVDILFSGVAVLHRSTARHTPHPYALRK